MAYNVFAKYYDILTGNVNCRKQADSILRLFDVYGKRPSLLLDLACGTGNMSVEFAKSDISVIGVDSSQSMLAQAYQKAVLQNFDILFLCQRMQDLDLYGTIDGAICCLDSINHLVKLEDVQRVFDRVSLFMEKDGLFIFDVNTPYKHEFILSNNTYVYDLEQIYCVWQNEYTAKNNIVNISLDFFEKDGRCYNRSSEFFRERAYTENEINAVLELAGFEILSVYNGYDLKEIDDKCQRKVYVAKKTEETNGKAC